MSIIVSSFSKTIYFHTQINNMSEKTYICHRIIKQKNIT